MDLKEKLFSSLGELIYAVAKADGIIQASEDQVLQEILHNHSWRETILWSFNYEAKKNSDPEQVYKKVINNCENYGPAPEYLEFINIVTEVAKASAGIDQEEQEVISSFSSDLLERFRKDVKRISEQAPG